MRVDNGRLKAFVSEQLLNVPQTRAAPEQMSSAAMAKGVNRRREFGGFGVILDDFPDLRIRQTLAGERKPERSRVGDDSFLTAFAFAPIDAVHQLDSRSGNVFFDPLGSIFRQRHDAPFPTFAFADLQSSPVEVPDVQLEKFAVSDADGVKRFEHRPVSNADGFFRVRLFDD